MLSLSSKMIETVPFLRETAFAPNGVGRGGGRTVQPLTAPSTVGYLRCKQVVSDGVKPLVPSLLIHAQLAKIGVVL